jgi:hypothetical protein
VSAPKVLNLTETGGAELLDADGRTLWASDSDEDYAEDFPEFLNESDVPDLIEWLIEGERLTEDQAEALEIGEWSLEGTDDDEGEDDDGLA